MQSDKSGEVKARPAPVFVHSAEQSFIHLLLRDGRIEGGGAVFEYGDGEFFEIGSMLITGALGGFSPVGFQNLLCASLALHGAVNTTLGDQGEGVERYGRWFAVARPGSPSETNLQKAGFVEHRPSSKLLEVRAAALKCPADPNKAFYSLDMEAKICALTKLFYDQTDVTTLQRQNRRTNQTEKVDFKCTLKLRDPLVRAGALETFCGNSNS